MSIQSIPSTTPTFVPNSKEVKTGFKETENLKPPPAKVQAQASVEGVNASERPSDTKLREAVSSVEKFVSRSNNEISFSIDDESGNSIVKIIDTASKEIIRQFPSEEIIAISHALDKLQGLFIRDKA